MKLKEEVLNALKEFPIVRINYNPPFYIGREVKDGKHLPVYFTVQELEQISNLDKAIKIKHLFHKYFGYVRLISDKRASK